MILLVKMRTQRLKMVTLTVLVVPVLLLPLLTTRM